MSNRSQKNKTSALDMAIAPSSPLDETITAYTTSLAPQPTTRRMIFEKFLNEDPGLVEATAENIARIKNNEFKEFIIEGKEDDYDHLQVIPGIWLEGWTGPRPKPVDLACDSCGTIVVSDVPVIKNGKLYFVCDACQAGNNKPEKAAVWKTNHFEILNSPRLSKYERQYLCPNCSKAFVASIMELINTSKDIPSNLDVARCPHCGCQESVVKE